MKASKAWRARTSSGRRPAVGEDGADGRSDEGVQGGEQALFLVAEVSVEGASRDPRQLEQVLDPGSLVALLGDDGDQGREEPLALVARDLLRRQPPPRLQLALAQRASVPPRRPDHLDRTITGHVATSVDARICQSDLIVGAILSEHKVFSQLCEENLSWDLIFA